LTAVSGVRFRQIIESDLHVWLVLFVCGFLLVASFPLSFLD